MHCQHLLTFFVLVACPVSAIAQANLERPPESTATPTLCSVQPADDDPTKVQLKWQVKLKEPVAEQYEEAVPFSENGIVLTRTEVRTRMVNFKMLARTLSADELKLSTMDGVPIERQEAQQKLKNPLFAFWEKAPAGFLRQVVSKDVLVIHHEPKAEDKLK